MVPPTRAVLVAVLILSVVTLGSRPARGHDPLEATTTVEVGARWIEVRSVLGSRRAFTACGRIRFEVCARELYRLSVAGVVLPAESARADLRADGDLELVTRHRCPTTSGALRILALHVQRHPNEMTGTTLVVTETDRTLRRETLDGDRPSVELPLPRRRP